MDDNFSSQNSKLNQEPWSPDKICQHADKWSLAGDAGLLLLLQRIGDKVVNRSKETLEQIDELSRELTKTSISVSNLNNQFMGLQHTQFIESRVYEEDETCNEESTSTIVNEKKSSDDPFDNVDITRSIIEDGLRVFKSHFDRIEVPNSDSEDDLDEPSFILRPKDDISETNLPYVIGSEDWFAHDHVGLEKEDSLESLNDLDDSDHKDSSDFKIPESDSESSFGGVSDKANLYPNNQKMHGETQNRNSSSNSETGYEASTCKSSFNETLTEKLNSVIEKKILAPPALSDQDIYGKPEIDKISRPKPIKTRTDGLFFDEPPPIDEVDQQDLFASVIGDNKFMPTEGGLFDDFENENLWDVEPNTKAQESTSKKNFTIREFDDETVAKVDSNTKKSDSIMIDKKKADTMGLFGDDNDSDDIFSNLSKPKTAVTNEFSANNETEITKKPIGGISYLGANRELINQSISDAIKSRQKSSSDDAEVADIKVEKKVDIFKSKLASKVAAENVQSTTEDKDIFEAKPTKKPSKSVNLFADDFSNSQIKSRSNLFDDVDEDTFDFLKPKKDLFSNKKDTPKDVQIKEKNDNKIDLFSEKKSTKIKPSKPISLFDDEPPPLDVVGSELSGDDIFSTNLSKSHDLFSDVDDSQLFKDEENVEEKHSDLKPQKIEKSVNLFETKIENRGNDSTVKSNVVEKEVVDQKNDTEKINRQKIEESSKGTTNERKIAGLDSKDLFSDNSNDLFSLNKNSPDFTKKKSNPEIKNVFSAKTSENVLSSGGDEKIISSNSNEVQKTSPKKLKHSLNINVGALLPGATRPKSASENITPVHIEEPPVVREDNQNRSTEEKSQPLFHSSSNDSSVLDSIEKIETLHSLTQERAKIPTKRRPSTRRARKEALSASDNFNSSDSTENETSTRITENSKISSESTNQNYVSVTPKEIIFEEEIVFKTDSKTSENIKPKEQKQGSNQKKISLFDSIDELDDEKSANLFGKDSIQADNDTSKPSISSVLFGETTSKTIPNFLKDDEDDIFKILPVKSKDSLKNDSQSDDRSSKSIIQDKSQKEKDIFDPSLSSLSGKKEQKKNFLFDDNDDVEDIFQTKISNTNKSGKSPLLDGEDDFIFNPKSKKLPKSVPTNTEDLFDKKSKSSKLFDDFSPVDDIFSTDIKGKGVGKSVSANTNDSIVKPKKTSQLFDESSPVEDIFSAEKSRNVVSKKMDKKKDVASLFDDEDDDDSLFGGVASKKVVNPIAKAVSSKSALPKKGDAKKLFDDEDDDDDLFFSKSQKERLTNKSSSSTSDVKVNKVSKTLVYDDPLMFKDSD